MIDRTYFDEDTLAKAREAIMRGRKISEEDATGLISELQNAGILLRERIMIDAESPLTTRGSRIPSTLAEMHPMAAYNLGWQEARTAERDLVEAIRLTVEYVGTETLPPLPGWSWYDALVKADPALAEKFANEAEVRGMESAESEMATTQAEEPAEWKIQRAFLNGYREGLERGARGRLDHS